MSADNGVVNLVCYNNGVVNFLARNMNMLCPKSVTNPPAKMEGLELPCTITKFDTRNRGSICQSRNLLQDKSAGRFT